MLRTYTAATAAALILTALLATTVLAQGVKNYAVLPFDYMGPEKYQHYGKSVRSVVRSKLNSPGVFEPAPETNARMLGDTPPATPSDAVSKLLAADVDYLVYGMVSMAGENAILEINAIGQAGNVVTRSTEVPHDQLSLELNKQAKSITNELFHVSEPQDKPKAIGQESPNPAFLASQPAEQSPNANSVNPEFRYEGGSQNSGRIQSQGLRFASRAMVICDGDGDGINEIFILSDYKLMAYHFEQGKLLLQGEMRFPNRNDPLNLSAIDSNKDGRYELVVTTFYEGAQSYVYEYNAGQFSTKVERSNYFLNVIRTPPNFTPMLVAQRMSNTGMFRSTGAKEAFISKGDIVTGRGIPLPAFGNIYNVAYLPEEDSYKIILLDAFNRLKVFTSDLEPDSTSLDTFNSSAVPISLGATAVPGLESTRETMEEQYYYIPIKMQITNLFTDKQKYELLLNKDISIAAQVFARFKSFTQGEIHSMFWDGTGMNLAWKTRRIKGTVIAYEIADPDNDGKLNLVVLVNTYPGAIATANIKTVMLSYDLKL